MSRIETIAEGVTLYLGDCREILPTLGKIDAVVVTDPPYGTRVSVNGGLKTRGHRSYDPKCKANIWEPLYGDSAPFDPAVLVQFKNVIAWGANNYSSRLPDSPCWLAWDKKTERGADSNLGDAELAWSKGLPYKSIRIFRHMWAGFQRDSEVGQKPVHPTQKPVALMQWCIQFFPEATTILDAYLGSGTTGVAAVSLGRKFIGIEIEPKYFDIACRRIAAATKQTDLFIDKPKPAEQVQLI